MNDMTQVIVPKSDQINADDLIGGAMTITIRDVQIKGGQEQPVSIYFDGSDKAFRPCKSMSRVLVAAWGPDAKVYVGRSLTLYRDATVKWGGMDVGGIRISHMTHLDSAMTMALTATKGSRKPFTVKPLQMGQAAQFSIDDARAALNAAGSLDDLRTEWTRRSMAPYRDALAGLLEERKAALSPADVEQGRSDADHGEATHTDHAEIDETAHPAAIKAQAIIDQINARESAFAIDNILKDNRGDLTAMPEEFRSPVYAAAEARKAEVV